MKTNNCPWAALAATTFALARMRPGDDNRMTEPRRRRT